MFGAIYLICGTISSAIAGIVHAKQNHESKEYFCNAWSKGKNRQKTYLDWKGKERDIDSNCLVHTGYDSYGHFVKKDLKTLKVIKDITSEKRNEEAENLYMSGQRFVPIKYDYKKEWAKWVGVKESQPSYINPNDYIYETICYDFKTHQYCYINSISFEEIGKRLWKLENMDRTKYNQLKKEQLINYIPYSYKFYISVTTGKIIERVNENENIYFYGLNSRKFTKEEVLRLIEEYNSYVDSGIIKKGFIENDNGTKIQIDSSREKIVKWLPLFAAIGNNIV